MSDEGAMILELGGAVVLIAMVGIPILVLLKVAISDLKQNGFKAARQTWKEILKSLLKTIAISAITFIGIMTFISIVGSILFGMGKILGII